MAAGVMWSGGRARGGRELGSQQLEGCTLAGVMAAGSWGHGSWQLGSWQLAAGVMAAVLNVLQEILRRLHGNGLKCSVYHCPWDLLNDKVPEPGPSTSSRTGTMTPLAEPSPWHQ